MSPRQLDLLDEPSSCDSCERRGRWHAPGAGLQRAEIIVAVPAVTPEAEALGQVLHPASRDYAWLDFLFRHVGYPLEQVRRTPIVRCASSKPPSPESVSQCRQLLADEIRSTGARSLIVVGEGPWSHLVADPKALTFHYLTETIDFGEGLHVPTFFIRGLEKALEIESPFVPPEALARDLELVADAVRAANPNFSPTPVEARPLFDDFLREFLGYPQERFVLSDAGNMNYWAKVAARLEGIGLDKADHNPLLSQLRQLFLTGSQGYRTYGFKKHRQSGKRSRFSGDWVTTASKRASDNLIAMHLTGELLLSSFAIDTRPVLSFDLDRHNDLQRAHFDKTLEDLRKLFPQAFFIQSSRSGGVHAHLFLKRAVEYKELTALARLYLQRNGLGWVFIDRLSYERVEVPDQGLRLPFGPGSFPLLPDFDENSSVPDMLAQLFYHANNNQVDPTDLFQNERHDVDERLRNKRRPDTSEERTAIAKKLLTEEIEQAQAIISDAISDVELESRLQLDQYCHLFVRAPKYVKRLYVLGIPTYGTRWRSTPRIAVWLATAGCNEDMALEVLTDWVENRTHASRDIESTPDRVIDELPSVIRSAFEYAQSENYIPGPVTTGDVRCLVELLNTPGRFDPHRLPHGFHRELQTQRNPRTGRVDVRSAVVMHSDITPQRSGTQNLHFLELGFHLISFLRGHNGTIWIARNILRTWGGRDYASHMEAFIRLGMISRVAEPSMTSSQATTFQLLWPQHDGDQVLDLMDALAAVMSRDEITRNFNGRPGIIKKLIIRHSRPATQGG